MKHNQIIQTTCAAAVLLGVSSLQAAVNPWTGGGADHDWASAANWTSNPSVPVTGTGTTGDILYMDTAAAGDYAIYAAAQGTSFYNKVHVGYNADGRLDVTGGLLIGDNTGNAYIGRAGHAGTLNIAGGTFRAGGLLAVGIDDGSVGTVNVSSGTLELNRDTTQNGIAHTTLALGAGGTGQGTLNLSGGNVNTRFGVLVGQSSLAGSGTFHVMGSGLAKIGTDNGANPANSGFWYQRGNGTLAASVDSTGFTLGAINIINGSSAPAAYVTFDSGSILSLDFSGAAPTSAMSWDLMTWDDNTTLTDNGLTLAAGDAAAGWSFGFVDTGGTQTVNALRITFTPVPEPTVAALAGIGLLALIFKARKRI